MLAFLVLLLEQKECGLNKYMMDNYIHTSSVSGWPVDSRGAPTDALKQMMGSQKSQLIALTSGGAS